MPTVPDYSVFGHTYTTGEFQLLLEAAKALVFSVVGGGIAAYIVYRLNKNAKRREQDDALYNDLIRPRILAVNNLNAGLAALAVEYLAVLDTFEKHPPVGDLLASETNAELRALRRERLVREHEMQANELLETFRKALPDRAADLTRKADADRYTLGERQYLEFKRRVGALVRDINAEWDYMFSRKAPQILGSLKRDTPDEIRSSMEDVADRLASAYRMLAKLSRRRIERFLSAISSEFETVVRTKGLSTLGVTPGTVPSETQQTLMQIEEFSIEILEQEIEKENRRRSAKK